MEDHPATEDPEEDSDPALSPDPDDSAEPALPPDPALSPDPARPVDPAQTPDPAVSSDPEKEKKEEGVESTPKEGMLIMIILLQIDDIYRDFYGQD